MIQQPHLAARVWVEALTHDLSVFQKFESGRHSAMNRFLIRCRRVADDGLLQFVLSLPEGFEPFAVNQGEKEA